VSAETPATHPPRWRVFLSRIPVTVVGLITTALAILILVLPILPGERTLSLQLGGVSSQEVLAPRPKTYISQVLTRQAQEQAAALVAPVYDPPDPLIARQQAESLQTALVFIANVRNDSYSTTEEKIADLQAMKPFALSTERATQILQLSDPDWELVQQEAKTVLERIMRQSIGPDRLEDIRNSIPAYISLSLPESQIPLVVDLVRNLVIPNSFYNEAATQNLRDQAASNTLPVTRSFAQGQVVIPRGKVVDEADLEAVSMLGLTTAALNLRNASSIALTVILAALLLSAFISQFHREMTHGLRLAFLFCLFILVFLTIARFMVPDHTVLPYLFPMAALGIMVANIYGRGLGILTAMLLSTIIGLMGGIHLEIALFGSLSSLTAILVMGKNEKALRFFIAGLAAGIVGAIVVIITQLPEPASDLTGIVTLSVASLANGFLSGSLALGGIFLVGNIFDLTTNLQLLDLSRPDHPLLREILLQAPGTYQHSLQVANLSEYAGERIGANTLLLRVGALYHDAGKAVSPGFFVENQLPNGNPHDRLDPESSARLIIQHVHDGLKLARKHRLPTQVRALIAEHHGTLRTNFQYGLAVQAAGGDPLKVDDSKFRYSGPAPQSKEAAILMLADGIEAKFRADSPANPEEIEKLVGQVIDDRMSQHQFDQTDLTMHDLKVIGEAFQDALRGRIHARLRYPEEEKASTEKLV
jgi:putative nucleotidyltransferase with HDIG domain